MNNAINALVEGFKDGGCSFVSNYPGFKSHDIFFGLGGERISINERVAYEMAFGASLAGKRSLVAFKGTGFNFASDVILHSVIGGVNAGLVLVLTDDIEAVSSPERQDSRPYIDFYGGLWLEPTSIEQAYSVAHKSFEWSERLDIPIIIRLTNQFFKLTGEFVKKDQLSGNKSLENRREKYVSYWKPRQDNLNVKNIKVKEFVDSLYKDIRNEEEVGVIVSGNCQEEISMAHEKSYFQTYTYPLPDNKLLNYLEGKKEIKTYEQGNLYTATKVKQLLSTTPLRSDSGAYKDISVAWRVFDEQERFFIALKNLNPSYVVGDEGTYTDESTKTIQMCLAMGTGIGITAGLAMSGIDYPWCVVGDAAFNLTGYQAIMEAVTRKLNFGIVVLDNGVAKSTGSQQIMGDTTKIPDVNKIEVAYNDTNTEGFEKILTQMKNQTGVSILYIKLN